MHKFFTYFQKKEHDVSYCWTLHPTSRPKHKQREDRKTDESGMKDSIIDVKMKVLHEQELQQQKSPWKWLGKKWMDFLAQ